MDDVVLKKMDFLRRCIERIESKQPFSADKLINDYDLQDIIAINLERAIQLCVDIGSHILADKNLPAPESMGETFKVLAKGRIISERLSENLRRAVGFRNISVHEYENINWNIVYAIVSKYLGDFKTYIKCVITFFND